MCRLVSSSGVNWYAEWMDCLMDTVKLAGGLGWVGLGWSWLGRVG